MRFLTGGLALLGLVAALPTATPPHLSAPATSDPAETGGSTILVGFGPPILHQELRANLDTPSASCDPEEPNREFHLQAGRVVFYAVRHEQCGIVDIITPQPSARRELKSLEMVQDVVWGHGLPGVSSRDLAETAESSSAAVKPYRIMPKLAYDAEGVCTAIPAFHEQALKMFEYAVIRQSESGMRLDCHEVVVETSALDALRKLHVMANESRFRPELQTRSISDSAPRHPSTTYSIMLRETDGDQCTAMVEFEAQANEVLDFWTKLAVLNCSETIFRTEDLDALAKLSTLKVVEKVDQGLSHHSDSELHGPRLAARSSPRRPPNHTYRPPRGTEHRSKSPPETKDGTKSSSQRRPTHPYCNRDYCTPRNGHHSNSRTREHTYKPPREMKHRSKPPPRRPDHAYRGRYDNRS